MHRLAPFIDDSRRGYVRRVILHNIMSSQVVHCLFALPLAGSIWNGAFPPIDGLPGGVTGRLIRLVSACLPSEWRHRESSVLVPGLGFGLVPGSLWLSGHCDSFPSALMLSLAPFCLFVFTAILQMHEIIHCLFSVNLMCSAKTLCSAASSKWASFRVGFVGVCRD